MENPQRTRRVLFLIAIDKLVKAAMLLFIAIELHRMLLRPDLADTLARWFRHVRIDPGNRHIHGLISKITGITPHQLREIRFGSYLYAGLDLIEGIGLAMRKRWAEWLTTISTALFLPLEVWEIFHGHHHALKIVVFLINLAIVVYLSLQLRKQLRSESKV